MSKARSVAIAAVLVLTCFVGLVGPVNSEAGTPAMVKKINKVRTSAGLPKLRYSPFLARSSSAWGSHLMRTDRFQHMGIRSNRRFRTVGEILAYHTGWRAKRSRTVREWMASPGHRAAILSRQFRYVGAAKKSGYIGGRRMTMWVAQFGARH